MMKHPRLLAALLLFAACGTHSAIERSRAYQQLADYEKAYLVLEGVRREQLQHSSEVDPDIAAAHLAAWKELLRDRARRKIFGEREDEALQILAALEAIAPDFPELAELRERATLKKARRIAITGDDMLSRKDYAAAMTAFLQSEALVPGLPEAREGMATVKERTAMLSARAQEQFLEAVRKLPEFRFVEVHWHAANVINNTPDREDAVALRDRAQRENALRVVARAREYAEAQQFGAALVEFKHALRIDPDVPGIDAEIEQMKTELEALAIVERSQREMRVGKFDLARELLAEAFEKSILSRGHISEMMMQVRSLEGESRYRSARDQELLGNKVEALAAFEALHKDWPEGVSDEAARIDALRVDIEGAAKEWEAAVAAEAAGELAAALDHYVNSERFYANWKDGKARIERLRAAIARQTSGG